MHEKLPPDYVEYFRRTDKSFATLKNMPESYKIILNSCSPKEWLTAFSIMCIYNQFKNDSDNKDLRNKGIQEIYYEVNELLNRGFFEKVVINDIVTAKIKAVQALI